MDYQAGDLDQRISLQRRTTTRDGAGGAETTWTEYDEVWAMVKPMTGRERQNAMRAEATSDHLVVIRYRDDVKENDRAVWRGRSMNIRFINNKRREAFMTIEAELGAAS